MKNFDDFFSVVTTHMDQLEQEAIAKYRGEYPDGLSVTEAIPKISGIMALNMLRLYHDWSNDNR